MHPQVGLVSLFNNVYQVEEKALLGMEVEIRYDPFDLTRVFVYHDKKFVQVIYPRELRHKQSPKIIEENKTEVPQINKAALEFFIRLKEKEKEIHKEEAGRLDFSHLTNKKKEEQNG